MTYGTVCRQSSATSNTAHSLTPFAPKKLTMSSTISGTRTIRLQYVYNNFWHSYYEDYRTSRPTQLTDVVQLLYLGKLSWPKYQQQETNSSVDEIGQHTAWTTPSLYNFTMPILNFPDELQLFLASWLFDFSPYIYFCLLLYWGVSCW